MKKFRRRKSAFALACASISGGKTQAMNKNKPQNPQSLVAVGGEQNLYAAPSFKNKILNWWNSLSKAKKYGILGAAGSIIAGAITVPVICAAVKNKKNNQKNNEEAPNDEKQKALIQKQQDVDKQIRIEEEQKILAQEERKAEEERKAKEKQDQETQEKLRKEIEELEWMESFGTIDQYISFGELLCTLDSKFNEYYERFNGKVLNFNAEFILWVIRDIVIESENRNHCFLGDSKHRVRCKLHYDDRCNGLFISLDDIQLVLHDYEITQIPSVARNNACFAGYELGESKSPVKYLCSYKDKWYDAESYKALKDKLFPSGKIE